MRPKVFLIAPFLVCFLFSPAVAEEKSEKSGKGDSKALFEDIHIVKKPWNDRGYRGMNGDLLQLKDGSILFCYTKEGPQ